MMTERAILIIDQLSLSLPLILPVNSFSMASLTFEAFLKQLKQSIPQKKKSNVKKCVVEEQIDKTKKKFV